MADNITVSPGTGKTIAADEVAGALHQLMKQTLGGDGVAVDASAGAGVVDTGTQRLTLASNDPAVTKLTGLARASEGDYETVAAGQTAQVLGPTGATGDFISHLLIIPASTSPGAITLIDGATSIVVFAGGASSLTSLIPFPIPLFMKSVSGSWKVTTGANVSAIAVGDLT